VKERGSRSSYSNLGPLVLAGLDAQLCGDAHLSNFGAFASPERRLLFDLNDFDETLRGRSSTTGGIGSDRR
jgi:hypothetical protein